MTERLVTMGRIVAPYGIKGWIKIQPFTQQQQGLLDYPRWQVGRDGEWQLRTVELAKVHGATVIAKLEGIADREQAAALQGMRIAVSRDDFPAPATDEFYWADLVGLKVVNAAGVTLGIVTRVFETGANDVLVVEDKVAANQRERLLPFIAPVIRQVDIAGGTIMVDWDADY
ncbi:MAG: ribosome maturation factor RimM [Burkholderiales bacterium]|nr:ribosome maturation factor RimM [Burkholderiales bacterium]